MAVRGLQHCIPHAASLTHNQHQQPGRRVLHGLPDQPTRQLTRLHQQSRIHQHARRRPSLLLRQSLDMPKVQDQPSGLVKVTGKVSPVEGSIHWWAKQGGIYDGVIYTSVPREVVPAADGTFVILMPPSEDERGSPLVGPIIIDFGGQRHQRAEVTVPYGRSTVTINELAQEKKLRWR